MRVCVACGEATDRLVKTFSSTVLTLETCAKCNSVVDRYIEYDFVVVLIDMLLMKRSAYRHILYNTDRKVYLPRIILLTLLATSYVDWVQMQRRLLASDADDRVFYELEWGFYTIVIQKLIDLAVYATVLILCIQQLGPHDRSRPIPLVEGIAISYAWKTIIIPSLIWSNYQMYSNLSSLAFVLSSVQVCRGKLRTVPSLMCVSCAHVLQLITSQLFT